MFSVAIPTETRTSKAAPAQCRNFIGVRRNILSAKGEPTTITDLSDKPAGGRDAARLAPPTLGTEMC